MGLGRVELPTSRLSGVRSNQLSYRPMSLLRYCSAKFAVFREFRTFLAAKKSHTSLGVRSVLTVDAPEGRVASVAINACDLLCFNCERAKDLRSEISDRKSKIKNLKSKIPESISGN